MFSKWCWNLDPVFHSSGLLYDPEKQNSHKVHSWLLGKGLLFSILGIWEFMHTQRKFYQNKIGHPDSVGVRGRQWRVCVCVCVTGLQYQEDSPVLIGWNFMRCLGKHHTSPKCRFLLELKKDTNSNNNNSLHLLRLFSAQALCLELACNSG